MLVGCNRNRIPELSLEQKKEVVADAKALLNRYTEIVEIEKNEWPKSFIQFEPIIVKRSGGGITIIRHKFVSHESGFFIPSLGVTPITDHSAGYEKLGDDLYYFWIPNENYEADQDGVRQ